MKEHFTHFFVHRVSWHPKGVNHRRSWKLLTLHDWPSLQRNANNVSATVISKQKGASCLHQPFWQKCGWVILLLSECSGGVHELLWGVITVRLCRQIILVSQWVSGGCSSFRQCCHWRKLGGKNWKKRPHGCLKLSLGVRTLFFQIMCHKLNKQKSWSTEII